MLRHDALDLRLRIRLHHHVDLLQRAVPLHEHPEMPVRLADLIENLLEVFGPRLDGAVPVDGNDAVARFHVAVLGRAVGDDALYDEAAGLVRDEHAEVRAAVQHRPDLARALVGRRRAFLRVVAGGDARGNRHDDGERQDDSGTHVLVCGPWPTTIYFADAAVVITNPKI